MFDIPGFRFEGIVLDWMHMADLCCSQHVLGNIMWEVFQDNLGGKVTAPAEGLSKLQMLLNDAANEIGTVVPFTNMVLSMLRGDYKMEMVSSHLHSHRLSGLKLQMAPSILYL